jgi:hypothetical protein
MFSPQPPAFHARYSVTPYFEEQVRGQDVEFSLVQQEFTTSGRVWNDDDNEVWLNGGLRFQEIHTEALLPDSGNPFPDELWDVSVGGVYRHYLDPRTFLGGAVSIGSASDHPFQTSQEIVETITVFFRMPSGERDAWFFFLSYSNNREYANSYPFPGVEYFYNPSWEFHAMVGFPMDSLEWRPEEDLSFRLSYTLIHNIHALVTYRLADPIRLYAGFDWSTQGYLLADRPDPSDRFFYDEKRVKAGVKITVVEGLTIDLSGGYAFGRSYWESQHGLRQKFDRVEVQSGFYGLASIELRLGQERAKNPETPSAPSKP